MVAIGFSADRALGPGNFPVQLVFGPKYFDNVFTEAKK